MRFWRFFSFVVFLAWPMGHGLLASEIEAFINSPARIETDPGSAVTLTAKLVHHRSTDAVVEVHPGLHRGWDLMTPKILRLPPARPHLRLISFSVPRSAPPGTYRFPIELLDPTTGNSLAKVHQEVFVRPIDGIRLRVDSGRNVMIDGESIELGLVVTNTSNRPHQIRLTADSKPAWPTELDYQILRLKAGESHQLFLRTRSPGTLYRATKLVLQITAYLGNTDIAPATEIRKIEVLPLTNLKRDRRPRLRGTLSLHGVHHEEGTTGQGSLQSRIELGGFLDDQEQYHVQLVYQGPDIEAERNYRLREELFLEFDSPRLAVTVGDFIQTLSPLVLGERGRGLQALLRYPRFEFGVAFQRSRLFQPREQRQSFLARYRLRDHWTLGLVYLDRRPLGESDARVPGFEDPSSVLSLEVAGQIRDHARLRMALAGGQLRRPDGTIHSHAALFELWGTLPWLRYGLRHIEASDDFPGLYNDLTLSSASINAPLPGALDLRLSATESAPPLDETLTYIRTPVQNSRAVGLGWRLPGNRGTVSLERRGEGRREINEVEALDFAERTWRLRWDQRIPGGQFVVAVDSGTAEDRIQRQALELQRLGLTSRLAPHEHLSLDLRAEIAREEDLQQVRTTLTGHLRVRWDVRPDLTLGLRLNRRERRFGSSNTLDGYRLSLAKHFANGHRITLLGETQRSSGLRVFSDQTLVVDYTVPWGVPVPRRSTAGAIEGQATDLATGQSVGGLYVQIGEVIARTDSDGRFEIRALKPGTYPLRLHTEALGPNFIPDESTPGEVAVTSRETQQLSLHLTRAAALVGYLEHIRRPKGGSALRLDNSKDSDIRREAHRGPAGAVIELSQGEHRLRRVSDVTGRFEFESIPPGKWHLSLLHLPDRVGDSESEPLDLDQHRIEYQQQDFVVKPGENLETRIRLIPRHRQIHFLPSPPRLITPTPRPE